MEKIDSMALWNSVCVTDLDAVKPITGKQYKGNSPKPYWLVQRATETFGPCGIGWGIEIMSERFERFGETEALHVAHVRVWYLLNEKLGHIEQMGQTRAAYMSAAGKYIVDEDAPKKSVTDGMVKCLSMLGFAGDIFSGRWDDSKYVEWAREETERREAQPQIENILHAINHSVTLEVLRGHFESAMQMLPEQYHAQITAATKARKAQLATAQREKEPA